MTYRYTHELPKLREEGLSFLLKYCREHDVRRLLELGTAEANTSIALARAFPEMQVDTIERDPAMIEKAKQHIAEAGLEDRIRLFEEDIAVFDGEGKYDLIFVDAGKAHNDDYFRMFRDRLSERGAFFFDNMVFHNMIYDPDAIENRSTRQMVRKIVRFREEITCEKDFTATFYDKIGDGILIVSRRNEYES
ncbi:MAG: class I SAM-dependent methyltransferase [Erysipelotrichaceae bacterium]|nr:class I SAM-dependent methyltransferase [Erysipelotrichaceae bacterium]MBR4122628.1 class I SAM-dependent methyltransferase [Erysipelotrichaceae bacterium]